LNQRAKPHELPQSRTTGIKAMAKHNFMARLLRGGIGALLGPRMTVVVVVLWILGMTIYFGLNYSSLK
jgi:hypothetical protein